MLRNIGSGHNEIEMEEKVRKMYLGRTRKLSEINLCSRNLIEGINIWLVHLKRYSGPFLKWTREEHRQMDQMSRKFVTHMYIYRLRSLCFQIFRKSREISLFNLFPVDFCSWSCPRSIMVTALDCRTIESGFGLQSHYDVHFRADRDPLVPLLFFLNDALNFK